MALLCALYSALCAQTVSVSYSNSFVLKDHFKTDKEGATFWYNNHFYCMETEATGGIHLIYTVTLAKLKYRINLYQYDKDMNEVKEVTLDGPDHLGPFLPRGAVFGGKLWVFYYQMAKESGIDLTYSVVDLETLVAEPGKRLGTIDEANAWGFKSLQAEENNKLQMAFSPDGGKLAVVQSGNTPDVMTFLLDKDGPVGKPRISHFEQGDPKSFKIDQAHVDSAGNRFLTYKYMEDKQWKSGILLQNARGREKWINMEPMKDGLEAGVAFMYLSHAGGKIYVFGPCTADKFDRGVFLTTLDVDKMRLAPAEIYPYPVDVLTKLEKMDYVDKKHSDVMVKRISYDLNELSDGSVVLTGYPVDVESNTYYKATGMDAGTTTRIHEYAGPLVNLFIKDGKCAAAVIPRSQEQSVELDFIAIPYNDKLICIYNDNEKSIESDDPKINGKRYRVDDLVLAYAVMGSDGTIIERKKLGDKQGKLAYFTRYKQDLPDNSFLIPMCEYKMGVGRYYLQMQRWAAIKVE